ncbi:MAG: chemotaxis protein CheD [Spirochaetales bacterium]|nr:chemotaxis protein CheD [Spirochaetales bacterium]
MYRKFDAKLKDTVLTIFAGEYYVSKSREIISTVLGSCISVCLYDTKKDIGGMNHFMLPEDASPIKILNKKDAEIKKEDLADASMRYGINAMEVLIAEMQKSGADRKNLRAKVFGGGNVLSRQSTIQSVGDKNIGFARAYLKMEQIPIEKEHVGDHFGRKIFFLTGEKKIFMKKIGFEQALQE